MTDPETQLNHAQRSHLYVLTASEGWKILLDLMEAECAKFDVALKNVRAGDTPALIEHHAMSKAASAFVVGLVNRLNEELTIYHSEQSSKRPIDPTEPILDLGETAAGEDEVI